MLVLFLYLSAVGILWWCAQGYFLYLFWRKTNLPKKNPVEPCSNNGISSISSFSIIVPTYNEKHLINQKIANLKTLNYPDYHVYFSDASNDGTDEIISSAILGHSNYNLIRVAVPGRSSQINKALSLIKNGIVVITDVDAFFEQDLLQKLADIFLDKTIGVVGGYVSPDTKYKTDISFWKVQNTTRLVEGLCGHSPVVSGAGYAFRREIINEIPQDTWADDIYVPFTANLNGFCSIYSSEISIREVRAPEKFSDFFKIKVRKTHDNIKELLRSFPKIFAMRFEWFVIYITRFLQIIVSPFLILMLLTLVFFQNPAVIISSILLVFITGIVQKILSGKLVKEKISAWETVKIFMITEFVLLYAVLFYFFRKNRIPYTKMGTIAKQ
ncbi:MAG: glycosyltransferase [Candidatus Omnitrophota bacterium]